MKLPLGLAGALLACMVCAAAAQVPPAIAAAQRAFEEGRHEDCLSQLQALERSGGRSPRTESIRALALDALGRHREAYLSTLAYAALTARMDLSGNPAHEAMLALRESTRRKLEAQQQAERERLDRERLAEAEQAQAADNQRAAAQRQAVAAASGSSLLAARSRSADARGFDTQLADVLGKSAATQLATQMRESAKLRAAELVASINSLMAGQKGRSFAARPLNLGAQAASDRAPYWLSAFRLAGTDIDYRITSGAEGSPSLDESASIQGLDLRHLLPGRGIEATAQAGGTLLRLRFARAELWQRGSARFSDGRPGPVDLISSRGASELTLWLPPEIGAEVTRAFTELSSLQARP